MGVTDRADRKIMWTHEVPIVDLTSDELLARAKRNHFDRNNPHSYHGLRKGIVTEQRWIIEELGARGIEAREYEIH